MFWSTSSKQRTFNNANFSGTNSLIGLRPKKLLRTKWPSLLNRDRGRLARWQFYIIENQSIEYNNYTITGSSINCYISFTNEMIPMQLTPQLRYRYVYIASEIITISTNAFQSGATNRWLIFHRDCLYNMWLCFDQKESRVLHLKYSNIKNKHNRIFNWFN